MKHAFLNTRLISRHQKLITVSAFLALLRSPDEHAILARLSNYGIKNNALTRTEADIAMDNSLFYEARGLYTLVRHVPLLRAFLDRFPLQRLLNLLSYFKEGKLMERDSLLKLYDDPETQAFVAEATTSGFSDHLLEVFRFKINQKIDFSQLPGALSNMYYRRVLFEARSNTVISDLIKKESAVRSISYSGEAERMSIAISPAQIKSILGDDPNLFDLKALYFLSKEAAKISSYDPLGEAALMAYSYNLELSYKFARALYFKMRGWIHMEIPENSWKE